MASRSIDEKNEASSTKEQIMSIQGLSNVTSHASPKKLDFQKSEAPDRPVFSRRSDDARNVSRRADLNGPSSTFSRKMKAEVVGSLAPQRKAADQHVDGSLWELVRGSVPAATAALAGIGGTAAGAYWGNSLGGGRSLFTSDARDVHWGDAALAGFPAGFLAALFGYYVGPGVTAVGDWIGNRIGGAVAARGQRADDIELGAIPPNGRF